MEIVNPLHALNSTIHNQVLVVRNSEINPVSLLERKPTYRYCPEVFLVDFNERVYISRGFYTIDANFNEMRFNFNLLIDPFENDLYHFETGETEWAVNFYIMKNGVEEYRFSNVRSYVC